METLPNELKMEELTDNMRPVYLLNAQINRAVKVEKPNQLHYVQCVAFNNGNKDHGYGTTLFPSAESLHHHLKGYTRCVEDDYLTMFKNYLAAAKALKESFDNKYKKP